MLHFANFSMLHGLWLMIPLTILLMYSVKQKRKRWQQIGNLAILQPLMGSFSFKKYLLKVSLVIIAIGLLFFALAKLRIPTEKASLAAKGIDVIFVVDVSKSMLAQDEKPTRLDKAKLLITKLQNSLAGNRFGLVVFAGDAFLQMPLTSDIAAANLFVSNASTEMVAMQGTNIAKALQTANNAIQVKDKKNSAIILITDGENHEENAVESAKNIASNGTVVFTVGIGSNSGVPITEPGTNDYKKDLNGQTIISKLNEKLLQQIAQESNGKYFHLTNLQNTVSELGNELNGIQTKPVNLNNNSNNFIYFSSLFVAIAILLLLAETFISEKASKKITVKTVGCLLIFSSVSSNAIAQNVAEQLYQGNLYFEKNQLADAQQCYESVLNKNPQNTTALYNLGNTLYRAGKINEAAQKYDAIIQMPHIANNLMAKTCYNRALAAIRLQELVVAAEHFKKCLKLEPNDADARDNLQKVLNELHKQKNQSPKKSNDQSPNSKNELNKDQLNKELDKLRQQEKQLQKEINKQKNNQAGNEKDW